MNHFRPTSPSGLSHWYCHLFTLSRGSCEAVIVHFNHSADDTQLVLLTVSWWTQCEMIGEWKWCIIGLQNPLTDQLNSCSVWLRQLVNDPCLTLTLSSPLCKNHIYSKKFSGHRRSISVISCQVKKHINIRLYWEYGARHTRTLDRWPISQHL